MRKFKQNRLQTPKKIKGMTDHFYQDLLDAPAHGKKVAWCIGPVPFTPLRAMGIPFVHLENYGARIAARGAGGFLQKVAEDWGLSKDACSYMRGAQGMSLCYAQDVQMPPEIEKYRLPKPDMVICINYCISATNIAEIFYRELKVPVHTIDWPYQMAKDDDRKRFVPYMKRNIEEYIGFLEEQTGRKMDYAELSALVGRLREMATLRGEVLDMAKNVPSPITTFDAFISMGAGNIWSGTQESIEYFKELKAEVEERVKNKVGAIENEKTRLMWDFIAVWARVGYMGELFASHNAAVIANAYSRLVMGMTPEFLDPENPVESLAKDLSYAFLFGNIKERIKWMKEVIEEFSIDGIIGHSARTCRVVSMAQPVHLAEVERLTGVPYVMFEADHSDPDFYSPAQVDTRIIAFLEMLEARKRKG
ncbi:MAG: 2-hydroxyacyl-CoA dehydratase family protein [Chloroflexota bacterium]|nr:2-hydroxyacyl-CoA dehydratase family protein [Chloroflexota bacterium]